LFVPEANLPAAAAERSCQSLISPDMCTGTIEGMGKGYLSLLVELLESHLLVVIVYK
jgi:hypothetical protein